MKSFFDLDAPVTRHVGAVCDLILLNLFFIISCVPVFTVGAAACAVFSVAQKILRGEAPAVLGAYVEAFRNNFRQATPVWLAFVLILAVIGADWVLIPALFPALSGVMLAIVACFGTLLLCVMIYVFPVISRFVCTRRQAVKNAVSLALGLFPRTVLLLAVHGILPLLLFLAPRAFLTVGCLYLICGFSGTALFTAMVLDGAFRRYGA